MTMRSSIKVVLAVVAVFTALTTFSLVAVPSVRAATGFVAETDLNGRDGPSLNANTVKVNMYLEGQIVNVVCQERGEEAYGSAIWDKTTANVWVPDFYVKTGYTGFASGVPRCDDTSGDVHNFPATADLDGRNAPSLSATVLQVNQYLNGEQVPVVCQATGGSAYGSTIWDKTKDGAWVTDVYVKTGYSGFATGVPRCTTTSAPTKYSYLAETDLNGRNTTSVSAPAVKVYPGGSTITITCQAIGENAYGSNIWDKTSDGLWVTDFYLKTGFDSFVPGMPRCADNTTGSNGSYLVETDLDGRNSKTTTAAAVKEYPSGSSIKITCQAYGAYAYGSYIWDKTSDGLWITDFYVKTGTTGFISNMPRCDNDPATGGPPSGGGGSSGSCGGHGRNTGPSGSTAGTTAQKIQRVIDLAQHETTLGLSYSWGAGGKGGPDCGISELSPSGYNDYNRYGFDCSGFTQYIFWAGAGVSIGANTDAQSVEGTQVSYSNLQKGDLLFWGSPGNTDHVAIYIGNGQMIEAAPPRGTSSVHVTSIYGSHSYAIRMI
jgi:cell wall-associated NlpC family hydrolase